MTSKSKIGSRKDAIFSLSITSALDDELPIDREVERLGMLGYFGDTDEEKIRARRAVYDAVMSAYKGPEHHRSRQVGRKKTPKFWGALAINADKMMTAYHDIEACLEGGNLQVAMSHIKSALEARVPPEKLDVALRAYTDAIQDFHNAAFGLFRFREMVEIAMADVSPKKGRPSTGVYYFVRTLGHAWFQMSGTAPTRHHDPIEGVDSGPFHRFCVAAAETVKAVLPPGDLDGAVRKVTDEWKAKPTHAEW